MLSFELEKNHPLVHLLHGDITIKMNQKNYWVMRTDSCNLFLKEDISHERHALPCKICLNAGVYLFNVKNKYIYFFSLYFDSEFYNLKQEKWFVCKPKPIDFVDPCGVFMLNNKFYFPDAKNNKFCFYDFQKDSWHC